MSYQSTLEDLAAKRKTLGDVIAALADLAGLDAAPYLGGPVAPADSAPRPPAAPKEDREAVPQARPTEGALKRPAGNQVIDATLLALLKNGPLSPKAISDRTKVEKWRLKPVLDRLVENHQIKRRGERRGLVYELP